MAELPAGPRRQPRLKKTRAAAIGLGLKRDARTLSPFAWAQNAAGFARYLARCLAAFSVAPARPCCHQQSFAPLVKRVLPGGGKHLGDGENRREHNTRSIAGIVSRLTVRGFSATLLRGARRQQPWLSPSPFSEGPGEEGGVKRIALGPGFIVDPSS